MTKVQRNLTIVLWGLLVVAMISLVASGWWVRQKPLALPVVEAPVIRPTIAPPPNMFVPKFTAVDENGAPFSNELMKRKVWIADFFFTRCAGPCPIMTSKMSDLSKAVKSAGVKFVSFSIDTQDTPEVLKAYARGFSADETRWVFAGGDQTAMMALANGLLVGATSSKDGIEHGTYFLLIDGEGALRGIYRQAEEASMTQLAADAQALGDLLAKSTAGGK